ncbi:MAG: hypothetical protein HYX53_00785 [Chloroflexi bacterium]|nr:hypothetical protein [Chloroflexota bacterium]
MKRLLPVLLSLAALLLVFTSASGSARANGVPQLVKLTYLAGVSNFGPREAEGVLEFSFAEAYARIELKNLKPIEGYTYEGWLAGGTGKPFFVATLDIPASGVGTIETKLAGLDNYDYNVFIVAARAASATAGAMPAQKSIAGRFTVISDNPAAGQNGDVRPATLPDTGEPPPGFPWSRILYTAGAMAVAAFAINSGRRWKRSHHRD